MTLWGGLAGDLVAGRELAYGDAYKLMGQVMAGELGDIRLASLLSVLAARGVSTDELHGMADAMRDRARRINLPAASVDIVGTGGDQAHTVNISTMAAIVIAAAGVPVVKHGNRASTSASGSADVLEALGVNLDLRPSQIEGIFPHTGIAFLFANKFHPSMRYAATVRKELGFPTAFNILGPLTNPAQPQANAIGVAKEAAGPLMAGVFARRGTNAVVFRGADHGLDELTTTESAQIWEARDGHVSHSWFDPARELGLTPADLADLRGGDPRDNARAAREVFGGQAGPIADAVALNAAAGLVAAQGIGGKTPPSQPFAKRLAKEYALARRILESGAAEEKLERWVELSNVVGP